MTLAVKVSEPTAAAVEVARGELSRSAWLALVISAALGQRPAAVAVGRPKVSAPAGLAEPGAEPAVAVGAGRRQPGRFVCCGHCRHGANITSHADPCSQCGVA